MATQWLGWHWLREDRKLQYPPHTLVEAGQTLISEGELVLCENGLHASRRALDALQYAPGPVVCRVVLSGTIVEGADKACATERTCLWLADATRTLHEFACWCATQALERAAGREPATVCWKAVETKRRWLHGAATDQELAAARSAAWAAARSAAWAAARSAARAAARSAAWAAARSAARAAARSAAWAAARSAAREEQNSQLEAMLLALKPN